MSHRGNQQGVGGFHAGELAVQRRAGVVAQAARLSRMLAPAELPGGIIRFLAERMFVVLIARDGEGRLWSSPVTGPAGFLEVTSADTLEIHAVPVPGDPLHEITAGQPVGLLVIEFATRRRVRINGTLSGVTAGRSLQVKVAGVRQLPAVHPATQAGAGPRL